jgi:phosphatidylglycerol:prolipoprotein diacylglycerol transferase
LPLTNQQQGMSIAYIIWNGSPEIFSIGPLAIRWYGLLFALGFLISQQVLYYIYRTEGKSERDVDTLTVYMVIATVVGARLGHVIFYQPEMLWHDPLGVLLPFEFHPFRFTGYMGLASHGGAIGILTALWIYSHYSILLVKTVADPDKSQKPKKKYGIFIDRRNKPGQSYLQVLDRIVIVVAITGALIRLGNFFNSEIPGKPSESPISVVFINQITESLAKQGPVDYIKVEKDNSLPFGAHGRVPIDIYIFFKPGVKTEEARGFILNTAKFYLNRSAEFVDEPASELLHYNLTQENSGTYAARIKTFGIARHPAQLYESFTCVLLFIFLFWLWTVQKANTPPGRIFGIFLIVLWSLRFAYEFLKENQVDFENDMSLNMGQLLSIPLIIAGIFVLVRSYKKESNPGPSESAADGMV